MVEILEKDQRNSVKLREPDAQNNKHDCHQQSASVTRMPTLFKYPGVLFVCHLRQIHDWTDIVFKPVIFSSCNPVEFCFSCPSAVTAVKRSKKAIIHEDLQQSNKCNFMNTFVKTLFIVKFFLLSSMIDLCF